MIKEGTLPTYSTIQVSEPLAVSDHTENGSQIVNPKHLDVVGSLILDTILYPIL